LLNVKCEQSPQISDVTNVPSVAVFTTVNVYNSRQGHCWVGADSGTKQWQVTTVYLGVGTCSVTHDIVSQADNVMVIVANLVILVTVKQSLHFR
jgi:hypothetical protein